VPKARIEVSLSPLIPALHNASSPRYEVLEETPIHRSMCLLRCEGFSPNEIAEKLEYSIFHVRQVLKQPWAEKFILETIHGLAQEGLERVYKKYEAEALDVAHSIMADESNTPKLRKDTAIEILKVARGQRITIEDNRRSLDEIEKEEELVEAKLKALVGTAPNVTGAS